MVTLVANRPIKLDEEILVHYKNSRDRLPNTYPLSGPCSCCAGYKTERQARAEGRQERVHQFLGLGAEEECA